jgi:hypothetical protein
MKKSFLFAACAVALAVMSSCKSNQVSPSSRGPVVGNIPCIEWKYVQDREELKQKIEKRAVSGLDDLSKAYAMQEQLENDFEQARIEEQERLLGTEIPCATIPTLIDENGNEIFDFFVDNCTATFTAHKYDSWTSYMYDCELVAQRDVPWRGPTLFFDVFFTDDDFQEQYGSLLQIIRVNERIKKGERVPCYFSIRNIVTEDPVQLQKKGTRVVLKFRE